VTRRPLISLLNRSAFKVDAAYGRRDSQQAIIIPDFSDFTIGELDRFGSEPRFATYFNEV
jgi:hypothetical protein